MRSFILTSLLPLLATAASASTGLPSLHTIPSFKTFITFGDSYTAEATFNSTSTPSGGRTWPRFVSDYTGATLHDYAVSGAVCSAKYMPSGGRSTIDLNQLPAYLGDIHNATLYPNGSRTADDTVYAMWIGTNDLGYAGFLNASTPAGYNITSLVDCQFQTLDALYATGARYFVLLNTAPLQLSSLYAAIGAGGVGNNHYWTIKEDYNTTEKSATMLEFTTSVNTMLSWGSPYQLLIAHRWPGATVVLFDVHSLITDIYNNPTAYLDAPANVTGGWQNCNASGKCVDSTEPKSSFLWYDELHPSERTDMVIARTFADIVVGGNSSYGTYWADDGRN